MSLSTVKPSTFHSGCITPVMSGYLYVIAAGVMWGLQGPLSKYCQFHGVSPMEVAFWRAFVGSILFFIHGALIGALRVPSRHMAIFSLFGIVSVGVQFSIMQVAIRESGAALSSVLLYTAPVWVALLSRLLFKETLTRRKATSLIVALGGVVLICASGGGLVGQEPSVLGISLGLLSGLIYAVIVIFYNYWRPLYSTASVYPFMMMVGAVTLFCFVDISLGWNPGVWLALIAIGALTCYGAFYAHGKSLHRLSPVKVAVLCNLEPVVSTFISWLWWDERFSALGWLGCLTVIAAMFYLSAERER